MSLTWFCLLAQRMPKTVWMSRATIRPALHMVKSICEDMWTSSVLNMNASQLI